MEWKVIDAINELFDQQKTEPVDGPEGETSLQLLQNVYRDRKQPLTVRVRCAVEALVHEYAKKGTDKSTMIDGTFAERLERELRAIERSKQTVPLLNSPTEPLPAEEMKRPFSRLNYRRF
jgi:hypothetical protein